MVSHVANYLDQIFTALADPTRRAIIARLGQGEAPVKTLAAPHDMALPSFLKHIDMLERAGLVRSRKDGRLRVCTLHPEALASAENWLDQQRGLWTRRLDRLADMAEDIATQERTTP